MAVKVHSTSGAQSHVHFGVPLYMLGFHLPEFLKPGNKVVIFEKQAHLLNSIKNPLTETQVYAM